MNQEQRVLDYLEKHGSIDPLQAWLEVGVYRLSARIHRLRQQGYVITTTRKKVVNRWNESVKFAEYHYEGESNE